MIDSDNSVELRGELQGSPMLRRTFLQRGAAISLLGLAGFALEFASAGTRSAAAEPFRRVRPSDPAWPSASQWQALNDDIGGSLFRIRSPLDICVSAPQSATCGGVLKEMKNPFFIGDEPALTETTGWIDAWISSPSAYVVKARNTEDIVKAVKFARMNRLRLVVKGGGHSYQGTSNAADSLLIWTRAMNAITLHDAFIGQGCGTQQSVPAVSVGAGAIWMHVYDAVTTKAGRYVQGGGCATVGVAGLIQSGGFGSFSKRFGIAAASLIEAEVVTADGEVRIANACTNPELFWGLKGGGGGSLGVVTRLTLKTHELPIFFGGVKGLIKANSDVAFRRLIARFVAFYADALFNPGWGEIVEVGPDNNLVFAMVFQGFDSGTAERILAPFLDWVRASPADYKFTTPMRIVSVPARRFWDAAFMQAKVPGAVIPDDRLGAAATDAFWTGNLGETGWFLYGYDSTWLPASLLQLGEQGKLVDALFAASRHWRVGLNFNKGLGGADAEAVMAAADTAMHPAVRDAFALAIVAGGGPPAFPGIVGHMPDVELARRTARAIGNAMAELRRVAPGLGSYVSEGNFFNANWRDDYWGSHYPRLRAAKDRYDPDGLFFVHHGVGAENWSLDGFTRLP